MRLPSGPGGAQCSGLLLQLLVVAVTLPSVVRPGPVRTISSSRYVHDEPRPGDNDLRGPVGGVKPSPASRTEVADELPLPLPLPNRRFSNIKDNSSANSNPIGITKDAIKFMQNFGYMIKPDDDAEFLYTPEAFEEAVKEMQKFGGIPQTGVIDNSTLELMVTPRCGRPDVEPPSNHGSRTKRYIVGSEGWKKRRLTYYLANWSPKLHSKEKVSEELRKAFDVWSVYSNLKFTESETPDADIVIFFATYDHYDGYPFDGLGGILAHAYYPYEFGHYGGDVHFDDHEGWAIRPKDEHSGEVDFFMVAVHEIGHSLGLAHSPVSGSIMFPYYKGYQPNFALDYDDIIAMWELYIKRRLEGDDEFFNTTSTSTTTTTTTAPPSVPTADDGDEDEGNSEGDKSDGGASGKDPVVHVDEYDYNNDGEAGAGYNDTYDDDEGIKYHGDYETVDDHLRRVGGTDVVPDLPSLPTLPPEGDGASSAGGGGDRDDQEDDFYEADRKRREEEERRRDEENKRKQEEEAERKRWEEERRRNEAERRRQEEEERRRWEEEVRRHEEEYAKRRQEEEERRTGHDQGTTTTTTTTTTKPPEVIPNICEGNFDAVALLRQELFVFKGKYVWRYRRPGQLEAGYPSKLHHMFTALPRYIQRVDAAYERPSDGKIVFFVGKYFYVHDGDYVLETTPTPITDYGLPEALTQLDAVMVWGKNQKTYFFSRNLYWRYNETTQRMDDYYPRDINRWNGIPSQIDGAFTWTDGTTHFFKGKNYWQFDNARVRPMKGYPQEATRYWTGCYPKSFYAQRDP